MQYDPFLKEKPDFYGGMARQEPRPPALSGTVAPLCISPQGRGEIQRGDFGPGGGLNLFSDSPLKNFKGF
jgi:hypothetical protein